MITKEEELKEETKRFIKKVGYNKGYSSAISSVKEKIKEYFGIDNANFNEVNKSALIFTYNEVEELLSELDKIEVGGEK